MRVPACGFPLFSARALLIRALVSVGGSALVLLSAINPGTGRAESVSGPLSIADLTARADAIVIGEVLSTRSEWSASRTVIVTNVEIRVDERLKGSIPGGSLVIRQMGGQVGDIAAAVAATPSFTVGERALLFLSTRQGGEMGLTEFFQGKFSLERNPSGRELAVRRVPGRAGVLDEIPLERARELIRISTGG